MECALHDERIMIVAMVNFAFSAHLGPVSSPTVLIVDLSNLNASFYMVTSLWIELLMTIEPLWSTWWISPFPPNLVLYLFPQF